MNRAQLRGKVLDDFCKPSKPIKETDGNYYCCGLIDSMTDEFEKATPHNSASANFEKIRVRKKEIFRRNTLCVARKSNEFTD